MLPNTAPATTDPARAQSRRTHRPGGIMREAGEVPDEGEFKTWFMVGKNTRERMTGVFWWEDTKSECLGSADGTGSKIFQIKMPSIFFPAVRLLENGDGGGLDPPDPSRAKARGMAQVSRGC